jgi:Ca2+-binding EF-hand superfamily protein
MNERDMMCVFNYFDRNKNGTVDYNEFLRAIRVKNYYAYILIGRDE